MDSKQLINKFLKGQLSPDELEQLINLLSEEEKETGIDDALQKIWTDAASSQALSADDSQRLLRLFQQKREREQPANRHIWVTRVWYSAAALAGLLLTGFAVWLLIAQNQMSEYMTGNGETRLIVLPDQSKVTLNANSSIKYFPDWDEKSPRQVWLDGEAYFSVVHTQNNQKFLVQVTDALQVEVLGTEFNVKERRQETQVVLEEGKVQLTIQNDQRQPQRLSMDPGDLVNFSSESKTLSKKQVDPGMYSAWKDKRMVFANTPLSEVAEQLEDIYGVTIMIEGDNLSNTQLSGAFPTDNLEMILSSLQTIIDIEVSKTDSFITIKKE